MLTRGFHALDRSGGYPASSHCGSGICDLVDPGVGARIGGEYPPGIEHYSDT